MKLKPAARRGPGPRNLDQPSTHDFSGRRITPLNPTIIRKLSGGHFADRIRISHRKNRKPAGLDRIQPRFKKAHSITCKSIGSFHSCALALKLELQYAKRDVSRQG